MLESRAQPQAGHSWLPLARGVGKPGREGTPRGTPALPLELCFTPAAHVVLAWPLASPCSLGLDLEVGCTEPFLSSSRGQLGVPQPPPAIPRGPGPTLDVGHLMGVGVVPGEEGVVAEAAKAVGA